ncbi:MAG: sulfate adenylyltransferase subunit 1 [Deltaproteobacteria bacterium]
MVKSNLKIVISGHVDHGKSTLIGRLLLDTNSLPEERIKEIRKISKELGKDTELAYLTDYLKEERENEMTIDTTQIFFKTRKRDYVIIDSPGHVEFIKNMLTGATQAEAAVLLIDANAGVKEQTKRHAYIVGLLGITNVIVVLNKMDLLDYKEERFQKLKLEFLEFMQRLAMKPCFIIPASAKDGVNISKRSRKMSWYKGPCLLETLDSIKSKAKPVEKPLRFSVQDVYEINGEKIIAGKVLSGTIKQGQDIRLFPSQKDSRVNSIKVFGKMLREARAGASIGLTLDGPFYARRGEIIAQRENGRLHLLNRFRTDIFWMSGEPLQINKPVTLRCSTQELTCVAEKIEKRIDSSTLEILEENASELRMNESGVVMLKTEKPAVIEKFDFIDELGRFVIEQENNLQGAGIITQNFNP